MHLIRIRGQYDLIHEIPSRSSPPSRLRVKNPMCSPPAATVAFATNFFSFSNAIPRENEAQLIKLRRRLHFLPRQRRRFDRRGSAHPPSDRRRQVRRPGCLGTQRRLQDFPRFFLHPAPVLRRTHAQPLLYRLTKIANHQARHDINDINDIIDIKKSGYPFYQYSPGYHRVLPFVLKGAGLA